MLWIEHSLVQAGNAMQGFHRSALYCFSLSYFTTRRPSLQCMSSAALPDLLRVIQIRYIMNPVPLVLGFTLLQPYSLDSLKTGIDFLRESGPATVIDTQP